MDREQVWREFDALPPPAQQQVADFIAFLGSRTRHTATQNISSIDLAKEPFVGMWQDRDDMIDSTAWVRHNRQDEWSSTHE